MLRHLWTIWLQDYKSGNLVVVQIVKVRELDAYCTRQVLFSDPKCKKLYEQANFSKFEQSLKLTLFHFRLPMQSASLHTHQSKAYFSQEVLPPFSGSRNAASCPVSPSATSSSPATRACTLTSPASCSTTSCTNLPKNA